MFRSSPRRSQRSNGLKVKHAVQLGLFLGIGILLFYQIGHSHDKKISGEVIKLGRKDLNDPKVGETMIKDMRHREEEEDDNKGYVEQSRPEEKENVETQDHYIEKPDEEETEHKKDPIDGETSKEEESRDNTNVDEISGESEERKEMENEKSENEEEKDTKTTKSENKEKDEQYEVSRENQNRNVTNENAVKKSTELPGDSEQSQEKQIKEVVEKGTSEDQLEHDSQKVTSENVQGDLQNSNNDKKDSQLENKSNKTEVISAHQDESGPKIEQMRRLEKNDLKNSTTGKEKNYESSQAEKKDDLIREKTEEVISAQQDESGPKIEEIGTLEKNDLKNSTTGKESNDESSQAEKKNDLIREKTEAVISAHQDESGPKIEELHTLEKNDLKNSTTVPESNDKSSQAEKKDDLIREKTESSEKQQLNFGNGASDGKILDVSAQNGTNTSQSQNGTNTSQSQNGSHLKNMDRQQTGKSGSSNSTEQSDSKSGAYNGATGNSETAMPAGQRTDSDISAAMMKNSTSLSKNKTDDSVRNETTNKNSGAENVMVSKSAGNGNGSTQRTDEKPGSKQTTDNNNGAQKNSTGSSGASRLQGEKEARTDLGKLRDNKSQGGRNDTSAE